MKNLHVGAVVLLAAAVQVHAALPVNGIVPANGYAEVTVAGETNATGLAVSGTLEKRGPGALALTNLLSLPGTVLVSEGTVTVSEAGLTATLPESLQGGLAFWVDAATNLVTDGADNVERWLDVREASTNEPYAFMRAEHDFSYYSNGWARARKPRRVQGVSDVKGLPLVDFGTFGAINTTAAWLPWRKADGTRGALTNIRAVFAVAAYPNSNGFLISDWDYTDPGGETNTVGTGHFWLGSEAQEKRYFCLFHKIVSEAFKGRTYINGVHVDSLSRVPDALGHVLAVITPAPLTAANFFNGRNLDGYGGTFPHIGGGRVGELLVYTNVVSEPQRMAIESYLMRKWRRGGQVGQIRVDEGGTAVSAVTAGATNRVGGVSGAGVWRKEGTGTALLTHDFDLMHGAVELREGAVSDTGFVSRPNRLFSVPDSGLVVQAETNRWEILSTAATNALVKSGAGELTITGFPSSVGSVVVNGGTLRLTQALSDPSRIEPVTIFNHSFEIFDNHDFHGQWPTASPDLWGFEPAGSGWTYTGNPTVSSSPNAAGIYKPDGDTAIWCAKQPAPDGEWVALIKMGGGMGTTFQTPAAGRYRLVFLAAARATYPKHRFNILIDGLQIAHVRTQRPLFERYAFTLPRLDAGQHTLFFQGVNEGVDRTSVLDDVRIERIDTVETEGTVTNGGFEVSAALTDFDNTTDPGNYSYTYVVADAGWSFAQDGVHRSGITEVYSPFISQSLIPEGTRCAFIMQQGVMSTAVSFPTNGTYELSFLTASRFDWIKIPNQMFHLHDYRVKLDGVALATVFTHQKYFTRVTIPLPAVTNAPVSLELRFEGINTLGGDKTSLIDDVRVTRLPEANPVSGNGFEVPPGALANGEDNWESGYTGTAWSFDLGAGMRRMSGIARNGGAWPLPAAPEGTCAAFLQMDAQISQTVTFDEGGYYTLAFMCAGRLRHVPYYCLHDFKVLFNGEQVGYVQTFDDTWRRYEFRLPYVKAGTHTLRFQGINSMAYQWGSTEDHASFLDDVRIVRQVPAVAGDGPGDYRNVRVELAAGAKLALDFPGQTRFKELWYDGHLCSGELDASNTPFITGAGSVYVSPKGTMIRVQ